MIFKLFREKVLQYINTKTKPTVEEIIPKFKVQSVDGLQTRDSGRVVEICYFKKKIWTEFVKNFFLEDLEKNAKYKQRTSSISH